MGQLSGGGQLPWVNFNFYKYSVRNIKSINMIVVYILVSCQLPREPFLKANTEQRPIETGRKLKANTVQQLPVETGCKLDANRVQRPVETGRRSRLLSSGNLDESYPCKVVTSKIPAFEVSLQVLL